MSFHALRHLSYATSLTIAFSGAAHAQDDVTALFNTMGLPDMLEIMHEEGVNYGAEIGAGLFQGNPSAAWAATVATIYDVELMRERVLTGLSEELEGDDIAAMQDFFGSDLGQRIIMLEVEARRALLDDDVEVASKEFAALSIADETPRYQLVTKYIDANDLIEINVAGAMNSNFSFYKGLMQGGAMGDEMSETEILSNLWEQEPEIRQNTTEWVYAYSLMAYQPLTDDELQIYTAFSETDAGKDLNAALFAAFDDVFDDISHALGFASTQVTLSEEL